MTWLRAHFLPTRHGSRLQIAQFSKNPNNLLLINRRWLTIYSFGIFNSFYKNSFKKEILNYPYTCRYNPLLNKCFNQSINEYQHPSTHTHGENIVIKSSLPHTPYAKHVNHFLGIVWEHFHCKWREKRKTTKTNTLEEAPDKKKMFKTL